MFLERGFVRLYIDRLAALLCPFVASAVEYMRRQRGREIVQVE